VKLFSFISSFLRKKDNVGYIEMDIVMETMIYRVWVKYIDFHSNEIIMN